MMLDLTVDASALTSAVRLIENSFDSVSVSIQESNFRFGTELFLMCSQ